MDETYYRHEFRDELESLLKQYDIGDNSGTPESVLAELIVKWLVAFEDAVSKRAQ